MNLLRDPWIPVRCRDGTVSEIAPHQLTEDVDGPTMPVDLAAPRADFAGAHAQFLVGLLQTACPPRDDSEWGKWLRSPPPPDLLRDRFAEFSETFELTGTGPRFLQDASIVSGGDRRSIALLLIEYPPEGTVESNTDHFIKRDTVEGLCRPCAATALLTMQINAPAGGRGHLTGIRGGGPLTTLIFPGGSESTLWHRCWVNVLNSSDMGSLTGNPDRIGAAAVFPWLDPTVLPQEQQGPRATPDDLAPNHVFWTMARRLCLDFDDTAAGTCGTCGVAADLVRSFLTRPYGIRYLGPWRHPLSPYYETAEGDVLAVHPRREGLGYRDWGGLVVGDPDRKVEPAAVVFYASKRRRWIGRDTRIWAFGYDMDNMKARGWCDERMPVIFLSPNAVEAFRADVTDLVRSAGEVAQNLRDRLKEAWYREPKKVKGYPSQVIREFWLATEKDFFGAAAEIADAAEAGTEVVEPFRRWHRVLHREAVRLFDRWATADIGFAEPQRIARASRKLHMFNYSKKLKSRLRFPDRAQVERGRRHGD